jgi:GNAT superfamily N-acetyltransferase
MNIEVQFAQPADAARIARLFAGGFRPEVTQLLVHGCHGAAEHIRMQLASAVLCVESAYFVARTSRGIMGAAELRRRTDGLFLNYIGVDPDYRGQRVGTALLSGALKLIGSVSGKIGLDVLHENTGAIGWYSRLGFSITASAEFIEIAPPDVTGDEFAYVSGLPQADLCHARFGFSTFHVTTGAGGFSVGRIGDAWFRLTDPAALASPAVFKTLSFLDPSRRVFAVVPASSAPSAQVVRILAATHRMETTIPRLLSLIDQ